MTLTDADLDELERLAKAAVGASKYTPRRANLAHACSPEAIQSLIAALREARKERRTPGTHEVCDLCRKLPHPASCQPSDGGTCPMQRTTP